MNNTENSIMVKTSRLTRRFGETLAVDSLDLEIKRGEIFGFLGPNGAGKTTTIRLICGIIKADSGSVQFAENGNRSDKQTYKELIGFCPQELVTWDYLTCREQLMFTARMYGLSREKAHQNTEKLMETLGLQEKRNKQARTLSGGLKRRLNIALTLVHDPEVVILDEPEAGLDPQSRVMVRDFIKTLAPEKTVIFTTHNMDEADRICDRIGIIDHGKMLTCDTSENLKNSIGEGDVLEIRFEGKIQKSVLEKALKAKLGTKLKSITIIENHLIIRMAETSKNLSLVTTVLSEEKVNIVDIRFRWNTLEDVFINLTGRSLRQ
ncbi:MAG: ABC transporter ATP-binding protein [Acidobacteria bacterium]|nr:ABC transporter ATP-binding protein [Acidobacteriota bacterium]